MEQNKWLFPIRMEGKYFIETKDNIVEALATFNRAVDEIGWNKLLAQGRVAAKSPEDQVLLRQWWTEGWKETPQLPAQYSTANPVMRLRETMDGWNLDLVYPNLSSAAEGEGRTPQEIEILSSGVETKLSSPYKYVLMRQHNFAALKAREEMQYPWTLFAADNTIQGQYRTKQELADALGVHRRIIDLAHTRSWNKLPSGQWVWYEEWGIMPISPDDEPLGVNWRERCSTKID